MKKQRNAKKTLRAFAFLLAALLLAGCAAPAAAPAPTVAPTPMPTPEPSAAEYNEEAAQRYEAGDYAAAAAAYAKALEQEPENFDAQLGLGKAERRQGNAAAAIEALESARRSGTQSAQALVELCCAYAADGQKEAAKALAEEAWDSGAGMPEAAMLLAGFAAEEEAYELAADFIRHESLQSHLLGGASLAPICLAACDAQGLPGGEGIGLYPMIDEGDEEEPPEAMLCVYIGSYAEGQRSGSGKWIRAGYSEERERYTCNIFEGTWADDAPNGPGTETKFNYQPKVGSKAYVGLVKRSGHYLNGLEDGEMTVEQPGEKEGERHSCTYSTANGVRATLGKTYTYADGSVGHWYAKCEDCSGWTIMEDTLDYQWGIEPWGKS